MTGKQQTKIKQKTLGEAKNDLREIQKIGRELNKILEEFEAISEEIHGTGIEEEINAL